MHLWIRHVLSSEVEAGTAPWRLLVRTSDDDAPPCTDDEGWLAFLETGAARNKPLGALGSKAQRTIQNFALLSAICLAKIEGREGLSVDEVGTLRGWRNKDSDSREAQIRALQISGGLCCERVNADAVNKKAAYYQLKEGVHPHLIRCQPRLRSWLLEVEEVPLKSLSHAPFRLVQPIVGRTRELAALPVAARSFSIPVKAQLGSDPEAVAFESADQRRSSRPPSPSFSVTNPEPAVPHNLPPRMQHALQRIDKLQQISTVFDQKRTVCITGLPGTGKASLALAFAHDALATKRYPGGIWWIQASGAPQLALVRLEPFLRARGTQNVISRLGASDSNLDPSTRAELVRLALEDASEPTLLVLVNADAPEWSRHLPQGMVHVLQTTFDARTAIGDCVIDALFSKDDVRLLCEDLNVYPTDDFEQRCWESVMAVHLAWHPLAASVAAGTVAQYNVTWSSYREYLQRSKAILEQLPTSTGEGPRPLSALDVALDRALAASPTCPLLIALSVFGHAHVPAEWIREASNMGTDLEFRHGLGTLERLHLIMPGDNADWYDMHPLVHARLQERAQMLDSVELIRAQSSAVRCVSRFQSAPQLVCLDWYSEYAAHVFRMLEFAEQQDSVNEWFRLADNILYVCAAGEQEHYEIVLRRACSLALSAFGRNDRRTAHYLYQRANRGYPWSLVLGQPDPEYALLLQAIAICEQVGAQDEEMLLMLLARGREERRRGDSMQARLCYERALILAEELYGREDDRLIPCLHDLAEQYESGGDIEAEITVRKRTLLIDPRLVKSGTSESLERLTRVLLDQQRVHEAVSCLTTAFHAQQAQLASEETPLRPEERVLDLLASMSDVVSCLVDMSDAEAYRVHVESFRGIIESLQICDKTEELLPVSNICNKAGIFGEAKRFSRAALVVTPPEHEWHCSVLEALAVALEGLNEIAEAKNVWRRAIDVCRISIDVPFYCGRLLNHLTQAPSGPEDAAEALIVADRMIESSPHFDQCALGLAKLFRAIVLQELQRLEESTASASEAIEHWRKDAEVRNVTASSPCRIQFDTSWEKDASMVIMTNDMMRIKRRRNAKH